MSTDASTEARLDALEQLIPQLGADSLQPNVITVAPDGTIGAQFSGHVKATGLDLSLNSQALPTGPGPNLLDWLTAGGTVAAYLQAYSGGNAGSIFNQQIGLQSLDLTRKAGLASQIHGVTGVPPDPKSNVGAFTETANALIIDSSGASSFLQLLAAQKLVLNLGTVALAFNGLIGQHLPIAHGLGRIPQAAGVWAIDGTEFLTVQQSANPDANDLYVSANINANRTVAWIAAG